MKIADLSEERQWVGMTVEVRLQALLDPRNPSWQEKSLGLLTTKFL
jgi:uncharacterized protein with NRDE domain